MNFKIRQALSFHWGGSQLTINNLLKSLIANRLELNFTACRRVPFVLIFLSQVKRRRGGKG